MKKNVFTFLLLIMFFVPCVFLFGGCEENELIGISARKSYHEINYGQEFDPITQFDVRAHFLDGQVQSLNKDDLSYTILRNEQDYVLENEYFDAGNYTFTFQFAEETCTANLIVNKIAYAEEPTIQINNFRYNGVVSMPTLDKSSGGNTSFFVRKLNESGTIDPSFTAKKWTYNLNDINTEFESGDYQIYAKVEESTNYLEYTVSPTNFHILTEQLSEDYFLSSQTLQFTFVPYATLEHFSEELNQEIKLCKLNEETEETDEILGTFSWKDTDYHPSCKDTNKSFLICFTPDDDTFGIQEFEISIKVDKLYIDVPQPSLLNEEPSLEGNSLSANNAEQERSDSTTDESLFASISYDGKLHKVVFDGYTIGTLNDELYLFNSDGIAIILLSSESNIEETLPGNFIVNLLLPSPEDMLWKDGTTDFKMFRWQIKKITSDYTNFKFVFVSDLQNTNIQTESDLYIEGNTVVVEANSEIQYNKNLGCGIAAILVQDNTTKEYTPLPEQYTFTINQELNDETILTIDTIKDNVTDQILVYTFKMTEPISPDKPSYRIYLKISVFGNEIYEDFEINTFFDFENNS